MKNDGETDGESVPALKLSQSTSKKTKVHWRFSPAAAKIKSLTQLKLSPNTVRAKQQQDMAMIRQIQLNAGSATSLDPEYEWKGVLVETIKSSTLARSLPASALKRPRACSTEHAINSGNLDLGKLESYATTTSSETSSSPTRRQSLKARCIEPSVDIEDLGKLGSSCFSEGEISQAIQSNPTQANFDLGLSDAEINVLCSAFDAGNKVDFVHKFKRLKVCEAVMRPNSPDNPLPEMVLLTDDFWSGERLVVRLRENWLETTIATGQIIHLITSKTLLDGSLAIDGKEGYIITYPDSLLSSTVVADSVSCLRRAVLSTRTQPAVENSKPSSSLICGSIVHEVIEEALVRKCRPEEIQSLVHSSLVANMIQIYCSEVNEELIAGEVGRILAGFPEWCERFLTAVPSESGYFVDQIRYRGSSSANRLCIPKVLEVEENIWSHKFGLKGKVDATVLISYPDDAGRRLLVPLEIKTSKSTTSTAHRAQTLLYTLMLSDRYDIKVECGLLYFVSVNELIRVLATREELCALVMTRNRLAEAVAAPSTVLPGLLKNEHVCRQCYHLESCLLYHKVESL